MIRITKTKTPQYAWLYLMLPIPGSCTMPRYLNTTLVYGVVIAVYALLALLSAKYRNVYVLSFCLLPALATTVIRLKTGGVGPLSFPSNAAMLVVAYIAMTIDRRMFPTRFIRVVCFFGIISVLFWVAFCINPSLVNAWPATSFWMQNLGTGQWATMLHGKGLWLYSYLEIHATRNCGFYTEPGVYQTVLNAVLFVLLFWKKKLYFGNEKQYRTATVIVLLTLITYQSTTGHLSMMVILLCFLFMCGRERGIRTLKQKLAVPMVAITAVLITDYLLRGEESLLYVQVLNKLFGGGIGGGVNLKDSTGQYRWITAMASSRALSMDPFGIGFDAFYAIRDSFDSAAVAASIATYAAVYGMTFWLTMMIVIFHLMIRREPKKILIAVFAFMFINSMASETYLFYPGLMMLPIYLSSYFIHKQSGVVGHVIATCNPRHSLMVSNLMSAKEVM